ncbi:MAG: DUF3352 domain-containing protein [Bacteroidales bacterium]|jgi:hypothetical protein|nr:DUF3352 domain-containing protein [Bacteroidales bacterium]
MARASRLFTYAVLIILILLIGTGAFYLYSKYGRRASSPVDAIPPGTGLFIKFNEPGKLIRDLGSGNDIWDDLYSVEDGKVMLESLLTADSLLQTMGYTDFLENGALYLALVEDSAGLSSCIIFEWPYGASEQDLNTVARVLQGEMLDLHYAITRGLCILGSNARILEACLNRLKNDVPLPYSDMYERVANTAGTNVDANIYINFERIPSLAGSLLSSSFFDGRQVLPHFGSWSEVDLLIKDDELLMNGYTEAIDSLDHFLGIFRKQEAQKIAITRVLPYNTSMLISFGFSDYEMLHRDLGRFLQHPEVYPEREGELEKMKNRFGPNTERFMTEWVGNELALATINPHLDDRASNTFLAIHAKDVEKADRQLSELASSQYNSTYREYRIRRITIPELVPLIYGRLFSGIQDNYFTRIEDYIVFANSKKSLENFINIFLSGKTLEQNENFKGFADNVSDRSNIFCYFNIRNSASLLEKDLAPPLNEFVARNKNLIENFEAVAVQFKTLNNMFFTSMYVKHNPAYIREDLSLWKAYLDAPVYGRPYFVKDHRTNNLKIVAFDTLNTMYLIDHEGNIDWKLIIGEKVISDVHTVDYYRNGKIQYLFNTANHIYLIDLLGRDVEGYPVELKEKATNGLSVFDYDNDMDYRILLALEDNRVYNFDIRGKKVDGWKNPLAKARVTTPVEHLRDGGKDYIVIADEEGNIRITDRRGRDRINLKTDFVNGLRSGFYVNETNSKGTILTTDEDGKLTYIKTNGRTETTDFGKFSRDHYFLYEDFDNKGGKDFIYLDGNKLSVFDRFKNVMFSWQFENEINSSPVIIPVSSREKIIGVVSENSGKIYLFDRNGKLLSTPDHIGKTQVLIGSLNRDGQLNMIVGSGNTIYNYYFR